MEEDKNAIKIFICIHSQDNLKILAEVISWIDWVLNTVFKTPKPAWHTAGESDIKNILTIFRENFAAQCITQ